MSKLNITLLCLFLLTACNLPLTPVATATATPTDSYKPCYYMWASQDLPEISAKFQTALRAVLPQATARAGAFGENCVAEDGSSTFGAMETDFYVTIPVQDLMDDETLGAQIEAVLTITDQFSYPTIPGPNAGFVEITFKAGSEQRIVRVPIPLGKELRQQGLHGAKLLQAIEAR